MDDSGHVSVAGVSGYDGELWLQILVWFCEMWLSNMLFGCEVKV